MGQFENIFCKMLAHAVRGKCGGGAAKLGSARAAGTLATPLLLWTGMFVITMHRGAEAGGILGVNTPHFFGLITPTFWTDLKMGAGEKRSKS